MIDIVITRHEALVAYLREQGLITPSTPICAHASVSDVKGKHVLGVLPHHLSQHAASITEVPMSLTVEDRAAMQRGDLTLDRVREVASRPVTYQVFGGAERTRQEDIERAAGLPQTRLLSQLYRHLGRLHSGAAGSAWGGHWERGQGAAYRALHAARAWIPYDLVGPGPLHGPFLPVHEPSVWKGHFSARYTAADEHAWAWAHRGGLVKVGIMNDATGWVDIDSLEVAELGPELLDKSTDTVVG